MPQPPIECACPCCHCLIEDRSKAVVRDGKYYCSRTCAYDCTPTTCLCIHDRCDAPRQH